MKEDFSPYAKPILTLKAVVIPGMILLIDILLKQIVTNEAYFSATNVIAQAFLVFTVEIFSIHILKHLNKKAIRDSITELKQQRAELESYRVDIESSSDKTVQNTFKKQIAALDKDILKLMSK